MARAQIWLTLSIALLIVLIVSGWLAFRGAPGESDVPPVPPIATVPFLNAASEIAYVGASACAECHPAEHASYLETAHSRALDDVDLASEPPPGQFFDSNSGRLYRIDHQDGELWHRESMRTGIDEELLLAEFPARYAIGSGRFSRSYIVERDGFLVESPVTRYAARPGWHLSPGYDVHNAGFERPITRECLNCHVGRMETAGEALQRFQIHVQSIDCERCHGAGSLHAERHGQGIDAAAEATNGSGDLTIVHPGRLSRADNEAICAQCHFHGAATVEIRGRRLSDFRPGQRLSDFCVHYGLQTPNTEMKVVGHVEQMRLSACYQKSSSLTCTTCHNPHIKPVAEELIRHYRSKCMECHAVEACRLTVTERLHREADDNCVTCHMPTSPTDIPHFAFTHHRIGIHDGTSPAGDETTPGTLVPLDDVSHLPQIEQDRCLGLAYMQLAGSSEQAANAEVYRNRARELLHAVRERGLRDPEVDSTLARLYWSIDPQKTIEFAEGVLQAEHPSPEARATALFALGSTHLQSGEFRRAIPYLEQLTRVRLYSEGSFMLSLCRQRTGDLDGAIEAAIQAAEIAPQHPQLHDHLANLYLQQGDTGRAEEHKLRARQLNRAAPRPSSNLPRR